MTRYIDEHHERFGVAPICDALGWNVSTYYAYKKRPPSNRALRDAELIEHIRRVHADNYGVYGAYKVWRQLNREGIRVARCTVERLMAQAGLHGVRRGRRHRTTRADREAARALPDLVDRDFTAHAPNVKWVADITYVPTHQGFVHVALVIDVFSRMIVGWAIEPHLRTELTLQALELALWRRRGHDLHGLIHHSDRGGQYVSVRYTERLAEAGIAPSVGSVGDSYDNAMAESTIGLLKTELIERHGPWRTRDQVVYETLPWIDWFNNTRLHREIGDIPPAEYEANHYRDTPDLTEAGIQ